MKKAALVLFAMTMIMLGSEPAHAVPSPNGIAWTAPPATFVTSLYTSVLGRAPESAAVVAGWAAQVTSQPGSRLRVFWHFVGSPEYRNTAWARMAQDWTVWLHYDARTNRNTWVVSRHALDARFIAYHGGMSFGVAQAVRNFHQTFAPSR